MSSASITEADHPQHCWSSAFPLCPDNLYGQRFSGALDLHLMHIKVFIKCCGLLQNGLLS